MNRYHVLPRTYTAYYACIHHEPLQLFTTNRYNYVYTMNRYNYLQLTVTTMYTPWTVTTISTLTAYLMHVYICAHIFACMPRTSTLELT
jgi:hypothetical protein